MERKNKTHKNNTLTCVLGSTHKTDFLTYWVSIWLKHNNRGHLFIFDPQDRILHEQKKYPKDQVYLINHDANFNWIDDIYEKYKHLERKNKIPKLLVLNAGDTMFLKPEENRPFGLKQRLQTSNQVLDLLVRKRIYNLDIIIAFQSPDSIPQRVEFFTRRFIVFPVLSNYKIDKESPNARNLVLAITAINEYTRLHTETPTKEYIHINAETGVLYPSPAIKRIEMEEIIRELIPDREKIDIN